MISFKGAQYPKSVILCAVYFYVRFPVSYHDLEEIMAERGVDLDHATLNRWVEKYAGVIAEEVHRLKAPTGRSWRMDETYVKVKGAWTYLYRAIDKEGKTLDFMLSERRDETAATAFFVKAIGNNGGPDKVVIDKSGSNTAGLFNMNCLRLIRWGSGGHRHSQKLQKMRSIGSITILLVGLQTCPMRSGLSGSVGTTGLVLKLINIYGLTWTTCKYVAFSVKCLRFEICENPQLFW